MASRSRGRTLLCPAETPPAVLHAALKSPAKKNMDLLGTGLEKEPQKDWRKGTAPLFKKLGDLGVFCLEKRRLWGDLMIAYQYLKGGLSERGRGTFYMRSGVTRPRATVLIQKRVDLD